MDLTKHDYSGRYQINNYQPGCIVVNQKKYESSLIITGDKLVEDWPINEISDLAQSNLKTIIDLKPEIILIGTGENFVFIDEEMLSICHDNDIPVEVMSTQKACMTYSVLINEQKKVAAGLIVK